MKKIPKVIIVVLSIITALFLIINLTLPLFAKKIIVDQIEKNLKMKASLKGVSITPVLSVNLFNLQIEDLFKADRISIAPNLLGLLAGKIVLNSITLVNPVVVLEQSREGRLNIPEFNKPTGGHLAVYVAGLVLKNGRFTFIDKKIDPSGFKIILNRINIDVSKVILPLTSLKINFKLSADLLKDAEAKIGEISFSGWIDFGPKDMDALLNLNDLNAAYFYPYYGDFLSERKITSAKVNLQAVLKSKDNDLNILTNFKLSDLVYAEDEGTLLQEPRLDFAKKALDFFTDKNGNLILDFNFRTKLDKPDITQDEIKKVILKAAARNIARQDPGDLINKISENIEQFKDFGKEMKKIFGGKE